jgi:hypothetical protein
MLIQTRFAMSADGDVTTPDGWPAQLADPSWVGGQSPGFPEFQRTLEAVVLGRTTFEPELSTDATLALESHRALPEGAVEIVYTCS